MIEDIIKEFAILNFEKMQEMLKEKFNRKLNVWSFYSRLDELMLLLSRFKGISVCKCYEFCGIDYERVQTILDLVEEGK